MKTRDFHSQSELLQNDMRQLTAEKHLRDSFPAGGVMDILAALKAEESKLQQQLASVRGAMKIVIRESKSSGGKKQSMSAAKKGRGSIRCISRDSISEWCES